MSLEQTCVVLVVLCCLIWIPHRVAAKPVNDSKSKNEAQAMDYLMKYSYLPMPDPLAGRLRSAKEVTDAIKAFQRYAGIPMTGNVDHETMKMVQMPRCGMVDVSHSDSTRRRRRRYAVQGSSWKKKSLTYMLQGSPTRTISKTEVEQQIAKAFKAWEDVTNLIFTKSTDPSADILVRFRTGMHYDGYPFDGEGGTLAHGFYPHNNEGLSGDVHFDDDENWILDRNQVDGTDFYWTALHEIGHSLGLDHSNYKEAVMYPFYTGFKDDLNLHVDDIQGIRYLYGMPLVTIQTAPPPTSEITMLTYPKGMIDPCKTSFDAVFVDGNMVTYFFADKYYWTVLETGQRQDSQEPYVITDRWKELPDNGIDAAYQSEGRTTFFKGTNCWFYNGTKLVKGPVSISEAFKLDSNIDSIDAAFVWGANGKTYLFKNDKYWRYNEALKAIDMGYPVQINTTWKGVPNNLDSAMTWINGKTYFLKGNGFWIFDNVNIRVTDEEPMKINMYWMKCLESYGGRSGGKSRGSRISQSFTIALSGVVVLLSAMRSYLFF